jgi:hypothetical protein
MATRITMTTFIDYVAAATTAKITCVKNARAFYEDPSPYPATAFYLQLQQAIHKTFEANGDRRPIDQCIDAIHDATKLKSYVANAEGIKKWMGKHRFEWIGTHKRTWTAYGLEVSVNPELAVRIDGKAHVIKLYLKAPPLVKRGVDPMLHLLRTTHGAEGSVGILDVQRSKLLVPTRTIPGIDALLRAEAAGFVSLWSEL